MVRLIGTCCMCTLMLQQISILVTAGSYFVLAMLDKLWHQNLTEEEAFQLHMKGVDEVKKRLVVAPPDFIIKVCRSITSVSICPAPSGMSCCSVTLGYSDLQVVDKNGIRDITPDSLKGTPTPGRGLEPGQGQAEVVVAG